MTAALILCLHPNLLSESSPAPEFNEESSFLSSDVSLSKFLYFPTAQKWGIIKFRRIDSRYFIFELICFHFV